MGNPSFGYTRVSLAVLAAAITVSITACGNDNSTNTVTPVATAITANAGSNGQVGTAGQALAISVHVTDQNGAALSGASVAWVVLSGGGAVDAASSTSNSTGDATVNWTLGTVAGTDSLKGSLANGAAVSLGATANAAAAANFAKVSGDGQGVVAGTAAQPLVVKVSDQFGNPIANSTVAWAVAGGGTLNASSTTTDVTGQASVTLTTDPTPATYLVTATGPVGAPIMFTVTGM